MIPRPDALRLIREILPVFTPLTTRLLIVGELRRGLSAVNSVDMLVTPITEIRRVRPHQTRTVSLFHERVSEMRQSGILTETHTSDGIPRSGYNYQHLIHESGIPVNIRASDNCWWVLAFRLTGSEYIEDRVSRGLTANGWRWNGVTDQCYKLDHQCYRTDRRCCVSEVFKSEEDLFKLAGVEFIKPENR